MKWQMSKRSVCSWVNWKMFFALKSFYLISLYLLLFMTETDWNTP